MRIIVVILAVLAGLKVWSQDRLYRTAMSDALVVAYRDRAAQSCLKATDPGAYARQSKSAADTTNPWRATSVAPEITIGNKTPDVAIWDVDNPMWDVRFRHPHIVLSAPSGANGDCSFDVVAGVARLSSN